MAGNKYLHTSSGVLTETAATQVSGGAGDAGKIVALNSSGLLDSTMLTGGYSGAVTADLAVGDMAYITNTGAIAPAQADSVSHIAQGFITAAGTLSPPTNATISFQGVVTGTGITGFSVGAELYLDAANPKLLTASAPTSSGTVVQPLGFAITSNSVYFGRQRHSVN